jgi:hypothetical protein
VAARLLYSYSTYLLLTRGLGSERRSKPMNNSSTTTGTIDRTDEEILTYTVSDEALEAAAGTERGALPESRLWFSVPVVGCCGVAGR